MPVFSVGKYWVKEFSMTFVGDEGGGMYCDNALLFRFFVGTVDDD